MTKQQIYKIIATAVTALLTCLAIAFGLSSCTASRVISTSASYVQHGDTTTTITTRTTETSRGEKK